LKGVNKENDEAKNELTPRDRSQGFSRRRPLAELVEGLRVLLFSQEIVLETSG
jgi:hypothetical protein